MARCLSKEDWVSAQSIKLIGNTAIPVVKLKTQILKNVINSDSNFYKNNSNGYENNNNSDDNDNTRNSNNSNNNIYNNNNNNNNNDNNNNDNNDCNTNSNETQTYNHFDINNNGNNDNYNKNPYCHVPHTSDACLSLDISFEGPGHYGLQANKMTKTLIKVRD